MFEVSSVCANSRLQMLSPLAYSSVDNTLLQTVSNVKQSLLESIEIVDLHLIHTLLHDCRNLVIIGVQIWTVGGHSSGELKSAVSRCMSSIVSHAR